MNRLIKTSPFDRRVKLLAYLAIGVASRIISSWISACLSPTLIAMSSDMRAIDKDLGESYKSELSYHSLVSIRRSTTIISKDVKSGKYEGQEWVGLPFKAMTWNWTGTLIFPPQVLGRVSGEITMVIDQVSMGIRLGNQGISDELKMRVLPLGIVPWAFAMNVLFYAIAAYLLLSIYSKTIRRLRRQRSLCESCGYYLGDRNGSRRCPECGEENYTESEAE